MNGLLMIVINMQEFKGKIIVITKTDFNKGGDKDE